MRKLLYREAKDKSLNGVISAIKSRTHSKNINKDGIVSLFNSTAAGNTDVSIIFDATDKKYSYKYWYSTEEDTERWVLIDFNSYRLDITAYTLYTGKNDYMPYWEMLASNDSINWIQIHNCSVDKDPSDMSNTYKTVRTTTRYIKMRCEGQRRDGAYRFAIYKLDFFGAMYVPSFIITRRKCRGNTTAFLSFVICCLLS